MQRWTLFISGRVQGVFYRQSTLEKARQLELSGYARNLHDGRVEVVAEGEKNQLQQLLDWCWEGPDNARVDGIELVPDAATQEYENFTIHH